MKIFSKISTVQGYAVRPLLKFAEVLEVDMQRWLQNWIRKAFKKKHLHGFSYEWMISSQHLTDDPLFLIKMEEPIKKFLEKNQGTYSLIRLDLVNSGAFVRVMVFFISKVLTDKEIVEQTWDFWSDIHFARGTFHRHGSIDEYEFYVWANPIRLNELSVAFIASLPLHSLLRRKLTRRIWSVTPDKA